MSTKQKKGDRDINLHHPFPLSNQRNPLDIPICSVLMVNSTGLGYTGYVRVI